MIIVSKITTFRKIFILIAMVFSLSALAQTKQANLKTNSIKPSVLFKQKDTTYWIANFRQFRDALFQKDKKKAKAFADLPLKNESNEIWYLVYDHDKKAIDKLQNTIKPFAAADFENYFEKLFSKNFVKCLLKIKTDELYKKGSYETPEIKDDTITYILYSIFDKTKNTLELNFTLAAAAYKDTDGELVDGGEFNIIYCFVITKQGHIKLKEVRLAG